MLFEKPEPKALAIVKLEAIAILMFLAFFLKLFAAIEIMLAIETILGIVFLFLLFTETKKLFKKDFAGYAFFFLALFAAILAALLVQFLPLTELVLRTNVFFGIAIGFIIAMAIFRIFFVHNFVSARVLSAGKNSAFVETEFDMLALIKKGKYEVKAKQKHKTGAHVKLRIKQGFFSRKPAEII